MTDKPPPGLDLLLTAWVIVVGVVYFGGYFVPAIGALTPSAAAVYALMVLAAAFLTTMRYLHRNKDGTEDKDTRTKKRK